MVRTRTDVIHVRVSPEENQAAALRARADGHSGVSSYVRALILRDLGRGEPRVTLPEVELGGSSSVSVSVSLPESESVTSMGGDAHRGDSSSSVVTLPEGLASSLPGSDSSPGGGSSTLVVDPSSLPVGGPSILGDPLSVATSSTDDLSWLDGVDFDVGK